MKVMKMYETLLLIQFIESLYVVKIFNISANIY